MFYLLVLGAAGAAGAAGADGGALVLGVFGGGGLLSPGLHPDITPAARPNSTIRVSNLFIVGVTLTRNAKKTSVIFYLIFLPESY